MRRIRLVARSDTSIFVRSCSLHLTTTCSHIAPHRTTMNRRIPIPSSFATTTTTTASINMNKPQPPPPPPPPPPPTSEEEPRKSPSSAADDRCLIPLNEAQILQLESALQICLFQTKKSSVSYTNLCALVPKLVLPATSTATTTGKTSGTTTMDRVTPLPLQGLSTEERLWHDFACVSVPRLYTMVERRAGDDENDIVLELQRVQHQSHHHHHHQRHGGSNRQLELRRLLRDAQEHGIRQKVSAKILDWLKQERARRAPPVPATPAAVEPSTARTSSPIFQPQAQPQPQPQTLQALEARIRAKAQERLRHIERAEQLSKGRPNEELVTVADALFSHARQLLRKRHTSLGNHHFNIKPQIPQTTTTTTNTTKTVMATVCKVPLASLLQALPEYNRQQLSMWLYKIKEQCPDWISWTNKNKSTSETVLPKTTLVSIPTNHYQKTRARLLGREDTANEEPHHAKSPSSVADSSPFGRAAPRPRGAEQTPQPLPATTAVPAVTDSGRKQPRRPPHVLGSEQRTMYPKKARIL